MTDKQTNAVPQAPGTDGTAALAPTPEQQLAQFHQAELDISRQGFTFVPTRIKPNKDACVFIDDLGESIKELRGVPVFKQKTRGYWQRNERIPECSSQDGVTGTDKEGQVHKCAECPFNQWGSGTDETGQHTAGKACKEMRRLFLVQPGNILPSMVSLPPTSIKNYDKYFSARLQKGIADVDREAIISLRPEKGATGFSYAVAEFKLGDEVPMADRIRFAQMREAVQAAAAAAGITEDDYETASAQAEEPVY